MLLKLAYHFPMRISEWLASSFLVAWGLAILSHHDSYARWTTLYLENLADIETWGIYALALGVFRMVSLFINGAMQRSPHARAIGAFASCFLWLQLSFGAFLGNWPTASTTIFPLMLMADFYNVFRAARDARGSDERAKFIRGALGDAERA
jgi:hypothetical protein